MDQKSIRELEHKINDYSGSPAHPGRSSAHPDRTSAHLI